jgi:hypothetical protein
MDCLMRRLIPILLLFLFFLLPQFGGQKKTKIGLLKLSVNTFDEERKLIEKNSKDITNVIKKSLEKDFIIDKEFKEVITYSDIEDPMVTIDPVVEPETNKKLEALCKDNGLDGVVFGHFYQEDKLIIVFRYYIPKYKYPKVKDRIISSSPGYFMGKINEKTEIILKNAVKISIQQFTTEVKKLQAKLSEPPKKVEPVKVKKDEKEVKPQNKPDKPKTVKKEDRPKKTGKEEVKQKIKVPKKSIHVNHELEKLTAKEVYLMIIDNGFYCEIETGSGFHREGLKGIRVPKDGIFKDRRVVRFFTDNSEFIRTESENKDKKEGNEKIVLRWPERMVLKKPIYFNEAKVHISNFNKRNTNEKRRWRIPTILELFSIIKGKSKNHFPWIFKYLPQNKDLIFWTSTPVKKEGTILDYDKKNQAYFVVRSRYIKGKDIFSISFAPYNIEGEIKKKAFLLPVYSDKLYTYKPIMSHTFDSIDEYRRIPGFDDAPYNKKTSSSATIPKKNTSHTIKITIFPYLCKGMEWRNGENFLNNLNIKMERVLIRFSELPTFSHCFLDIERIDVFDPGAIKDINLFYDIMSESEASSAKITKLQKLKAHIMEPKGIDIIVTVKLVKESGSEMRIIVPIVVSENMMYRKSILYNDDLGLNFELLFEFILEAIGEVVLKRKINVDVILIPKPFRVNIKEK